MSVLNENANHTEFTNFAGSTSIFLCSGNPSLEALNGEKKTVQYQFLKNIFIKNRLKRSSVYIGLQTDAKDLF